ncbi:MAG: hypothetical protein QY307_05445 [Acidimicrobiia bacterium]|nr:MAG: hypothetical protein QY307_05445 [Acidimicrobiia bacterium]
MRATRLLLIAAVLLVACAGGAQRVDGVVVAVDGDLTEVRAFEIVATDGRRLLFRVGAELESFTGGVPLSHLFEHLGDGFPVRVTYREEGGVLVAVALTDATTG